MSNIKLFEAKPDNRPLADFAPTIILKAKDFATEITIFKACPHYLTEVRGVMP
jgi:DNA-damage-inducible protein D